MPIKRLTKMANGRDIFFSSLLDNGFSRIANNDANAKGITISRKTNNMYTIQINHISDTVIFKNNGYDDSLADFEIVNESVSSCTR